MRSHATDTTMRVSLVLATVGRTDELSRMIRSLVEQGDRAFELIIVDQNGDARLDALVAQGRSAGIDIQHVRLYPPGLSRARNAGLVRASGDVIGFPDDDCWYEPGTIAAIRSAFEATPRPDGVVACWVEQAEGAPAPTVLTLDAWRRFRGGHASSISLFLRRDLLDRLDGFDERFGVGGQFGAAEETDLVLRALQDGARLVPSEAARVHHAFGSTIAGSLRVLCRNARRRARGTGAIYAKHRLSPIVVARGVLGPWLRPMLRFQDPRRVAIGAAVALGRIEGMIRWCRARSSDAVA